MSRKPTIRQRPVAPNVQGLHPHPMLNRIYAGRGMRNIEEADLSLQYLLKPNDLLQIDVAAGLIIQAIQYQQRIVVVGDFDCDGATGTAVAVRGLRLLGARQVMYKVPHRVLHGYGLTPALVDTLAELQPELIITVDSGIACIPGIERANALGYRVLVTDHHLPGLRLPPAAAIVNPNQPGCRFGSKAMAGVGVIFYLLLAVRKALREKGSDGGEADLSSLLDLVAIGTVADMVKLDSNNRRLVRAGLSRINKGNCQAGVLALLRVAGLTPGKISETDIGFRLGPKINAAGRLEDMALGIECLLADGFNSALSMAESLHAINQERQAVQQDMLDDAMASVIAPAQQGKPAPAALVVHQAEGHPGVIGLVASKLKEQWHRPVVVFAPAEPGSDELRGSCRSIPGFHIRDALAHLDAENPGLIARFGGHAMAAGLTLPCVHLQEFTHAFMTLAEQCLDEEILQEILWTDGALETEGFSRATAELLQSSGPWGQGFPAPVFDNIFELSSWQVLKEKHLKLQLRLPDSGLTLSAIHFGGYQGTPPPMRLRAVYELQTNDFREKRDFQCLIRHIEPV